MYKYNSFSIEVNAFNDSDMAESDEKEVIKNAIDKLFSSLDDRALIQFDGYHLKDNNGNNIGSVSVDWEEIDHFEDVDSYYTVDGCIYGSDEDNTCSVMVLEMSDGGFWYVCDDSQNYNYSTVAPTDGCNLCTELNDVDAFTAEPSGSYEEFAAHVWEVSQ